MSKTDIFEKLNEIFRDVFDDEDITVGESTTAADVEGWDSLAHIGLIAAIEQEFGFRFAMKEVVNLHNVGEMVDLILQKIE